MLFSKVVASAAFASVAAASHCDFGGYFRDPKHYKEGTFAGSRFVTSETGDKEGKDITLIGSDDGTTFWTIHGEAAQSRCAINVDFSPKGGPAVLSGKYEPETLAIVWSDNNYWTQLKIPDFAWSKATGPSIGGFYQDPNHLKRHSWSGFRMISDEEGDKEGDGLTLIGSDDGTHFWMLKGKYTAKATGAISIDFSPKGGPASLSGTVADGAIKWSDGNVWTKVVTQGAVTAERPALEATKEVATEDGTCAKPGDCGLAYEACCAVLQAKGIPCGCHLKDGDGKAGGDCGTCGSGYSVCCAAFSPVPCTCDISSAGQASVVV